MVSGFTNNGFTVEPPGNQVYVDAPEPVKVTPELPGQITVPVDAIDKELVVDTVILIVFVDVHRPVVPTTV